MTEHLPVDATMCAMKVPRSAWPVAVSLVVLAACGTRLPERDFVRAQQQGGAGVVGPSTGPSGGVVSTAGPGLPGALTSTGTGGSQTGPQSTTGPGALGNTASDVGVTATTITIGNIASKTNPFDPRAFVGPTYGLQAFVHWTNEHGGIHGRQLVLRFCDDQGSGDQNNTCVHSLVDSAHIFAFASNAILSYSGASYANGKGVPDVGSQPIDNAYNQYPNMFDIYGEEYPRDGKQVGIKGKLYGGTEIYRYFKTKFPNVPKVAGVVEYNQAESQRFGDSIANGLQHEGYTVDTKVVNFALPDYDSVAIDFKNKGVNYVYDTIDREGNVRLCKALDDNGVTLTAKVLTPQSWEQSVDTDYSASPKCRNELYATGMTRNYADTKYPQVAAFRQQMAADGHGGTNDMSEWALEGWAGGQWLADAIASCGADVTRKCVTQFVNAGPTHPYDAHGLLVPRYFEERSTPREPQTNCINVARWSDAAHTWVTQVPDMDKNCFTVTEYPYAAQ
jgi:branched-chain amino acid transport system substrate-binding protein